ncbi:MAG TPA: hypothetical protein VF393_06100 [archaeon]
MDIGSQVGILEAKVPTPIAVRIGEMSPKTAEIAATITAIANTRNLFNRHLPHLSLPVESIHYPLVSTIMLI